jgi:hypothetical protein
VGFDVQYHPLKSNVHTRKADLEELTLDHTPAVLALAKAMGQEPAVGLGGILSVASGQVHAEPCARKYEAVTKDIIVGVSIAVSAGFGPIGCGEEISPGGAQTAPATKQGRFMKLGRTYSIRFDPAMVSYDVVMRSFTGEEFVVTRSRTSDGVEVSPLEDRVTFKRLTLSLKNPW